MLRIRVLKRIIQAYYCSHGVNHNLVTQEFNAHKTKQPRHIQRCAEQFSRSIDAITIPLLRIFQLEYLRQILL